MELFSNNYFKKLNEKYERMLRAFVNNSWKQHPTKSASLQLITFQQINQPSKTKKDMLGTVGKQERINKRRSSVDSYTQTHQCWYTNINLYLLTLCRY